MKFRSGMAQQTLTRFMRMTTMQTSESIKELATALAKAQAKIEGAKKDSANPHFKNRYADLASVWDACRTALTDNGLSIVQAPGICANNQLEMTTMILHASGEWIRETLTIPLQKVDAQGYGSATTYARRYALAAMVGVAPEDDDGNAATKPEGADNSSRPDRVAPEQELMLEDKMREAGVDPAKFLAPSGVSRARDLPADHFAAAMKALNDRIAKKQPAKPADEFADLDDEIAY